MEPETDTPLQPCFYNITNIYGGTTQVYGYYIGSSQVFISVHDELVLHVPPSSVTRANDDPANALSSILNSLDLIDLAGSVELEKLGVNKSENIFNFKPIMSDSLCKPSMYSVTGARGTTNTTKNNTILCKAFIHESHYVYEKATYACCRGWEMLAQSLVMWRILQINAKAKCMAMCDLGCGTGRDVPYLECALKMSNTSLATFVGVDRTPKPFIDIASKHLSCVNSIQFEEGDCISVDKMDWSKSYPKFHIVTANRLLSSVCMSGKALTILLDNVTSILRPNGFFVAVHVCGDALVSRFRDVKSHVVPNESHNSIQFDFGTLRYEVSNAVLTHIDEKCEDPSRNAFGLQYKILSRNKCESSTKPSPSITTRQRIVSTSALDVFAEYHSNLFSVFSVSLYDLVKAMYKLPKSHPMFPILQTMTREFNASFLRINQDVCDALSLLHISIWMHMPPSTKNKNKIIENVKKSFAAIIK